jgi:two-component system sensor histidine kinase TctE
MVEPRPATALPAASATLRSRLQRRVLLPLAATWLLGTTVAAGVAYVFTQQAFDRSLLDDAFALAAQVTESSDGEVLLNLSAREMSTLLYDQSERMFFSLRRVDGVLVAGHAGLPGVGRPAGQMWAFDDRHFNGLDLRVVTLQRERPRDFVVSVGQTVNSRSKLLQRLLTLAVLPQALLLLALALWLRHSISDELQPLAALQRALETRDSSDLSPVLVQAPSLDVERLAHAASGLVERIAVAVQSQREFTGNVAHELRTPLAGIRALAEYGLSQSDPAVWRQQLQLVQHSEQRASHLVDQLLALAMADESREGLALRPVRLDSLVRELLLRTLPRADAEQVDLGAVGLDRPLWVMGSAALLEGLLGNLLDNALRHGKPADPAQPRQVTVELEGGGQAGAELLLRVRDNGPGLAADNPQDQRVLARWARGRAAEEAGLGTGLGLAIVARYASLLQARFELRPADPPPGLSACVWLRQCSDDDAGRALSA